MELAHHNDGKQKWQSHEISIAKDDFCNHDIGVYSHDFSDIAGYGATKEEALKDFKRKFDYLMDEWKAFEKMLFETNVIEDNIVEVDCFGNKI